VPALAALIGVAIGVPGVNAAQQILFASNAGHVNGIGASRAPKAGMLYPLDKNGRISSAVMPTQSQLRPGQTITGVIGGSFTAQAPGDVFTATASIFPALGKQAIGVANVGIAFTAEEDPYCAGDVSAPTAPEGILCVYLSPDQIQNVAQDCTPGPFPSCTAGEGVLKASFTPVYDGSHGFGITWSAAAKGASSLFGVWAYTAPAAGQVGGGG
jgi:hypothetical protein